METGLTEHNEFLYSIWNFYAANLSSQTAKNYYNIVKNYIKVIGRTPVQLTKNDADQYNSYLIKKVSEGRLSYSTAVMRISVMRSLCEYIRLREIRLNNEYINYFNEIILPDPDKLIKNESLPALEDINSLLEQVLSSGDNAFYLLLTIVLKCGLTASEVCNLCYEYIVFDSLDNICIRFPVKKRITRIIKLPQDVAALLIYYIEENKIAEGPLFYNKHHTQLKVRDAERLLKHYSGVLNINNDVFTLQKLRHSAVKYMLLGGASEENVAKYCGITTKWLPRYKQIVDSTIVMDAVDMSILSIKSPI